MATAAPPPAQPVQQSKITPAQTDPATGITYYGGKQYNVPGPTPQSSTTTQALPGGVRLDPATGQYRTSTGALATGGYSPTGQSLAYQPPSQAGPITMGLVGPITRPGQGQVQPDPNAGARAVSAINAAAGPVTLTPSQQLQLDTLRSSGVQVMQGLTPGQIASGLSRINPDLAKVAFHPAGKEGTYSPWLLTSTGLIYKTPSGAWEEFGTGGRRTTTLEASGASGSLSAILQNPAKYLRDVQAMGLAPTSQQAKTQLGNVGALPTTITTGGSVWSFPTYSPQYQAFTLQAAGAQRNVQALAGEASSLGWMQGSTIMLPATAQGQNFSARYSNAVQALNDVYSRGLASGVIAKQGDVYIPGPGQAKSEAFVVSGGNVVGRSAGGQIAGQQGTPVFGALVSPFVAGMKPGTVTPTAPMVSTGSSGQPLPLISAGGGLYVTSIGMPGPSGTTITGFKVPQPPLAGTPFAAVGAAYQGLSSYIRGLDITASKAILSKMPQLPAGFTAAETLLTPFARSFNPPVVSDVNVPAGIPRGPFERMLGIQNRPFGGTTKVDAGETAAQFMYGGAESLYKKPATTAISYGSMLILPGVAGIAGSIGEAVGISSETLASAGNVGAKVLGGAYGATVLYRVGMSPIPAREAGSITATEILPGFAGAASSKYFSDIASRMGFQVRQATPEEVAQMGKAKQQTVQTIDVRPQIDMTNVPIERATIPGELPRANLEEIQAVNEAQNTRLLVNIAQQSGFSKIIGGQYYLGSERAGIEAGMGMFPETAFAGPAPVNQPAVTAVSMAQLSYPFVLSGGATRIGQTAWLNTAMTPAVAVRTAAANDPLLGAVQAMQIQGSSVSQAVAVASMNVPQATQKEVYSFLSIPGSTIATARAQAVSDKAFSVALSGLMVGPMAGTISAPIVTPVTVFEPFTVPMPVTPEVPPPYQPTPQPPFFPELPSFGGGFGQAPTRRGGRSFRNVSFLGLDIAVFGGAHVPELQMPAAPRSRRRKK